MENNNLYEKIYDIENILKSFYKARLCKKNKESVAFFSYFLELNIEKLSYELKNKSYVPSPYRYFVVREPKARNVAAPNFRDRVVHHAIVDLIEGMFEKKFIYDSYACRKGKGTHFGMKRVKKFLQSCRTFYGKDCDIYYLQSDVQKFFPSIPWDNLLKVISKTIKSSETYELIEKIVTMHKSVAYKSDKNKLLADQIVSKELRKGLPIGNLTSQLFANVYLNELDHYIKHKLKVRWYARYMDDFLIIHPDKEYLKSMKEKIAVFLNTELKLNMHPRKTFIQNAKNGITFVGYRIFYDHVLIRGSTLMRFRHNYAKRKKRQVAGLLSQDDLKRTEDSFKGHLKFANAWNLKRQIFYKDKVSSIPSNLKFIVTLLTKSDNI